MPIQESRDRNHQQTWEDLQAVTAVIEKNQGFGMAMLMLEAAQNPSRRLRPSNSRAL